MQRNKIFISYCHKDELWFERVREQLAVLEREGLIDPFEDTRIGAGEDWFARLDREMLEARIALLLISASFLTSPFIIKEEIPRLVSKHQGDGMLLYPLLVRDCTWQEVSWLARLQIRPKDARPIASLRGSKLDKCLADVAREIASLVRASSSSATESKPATSRSPKTQTVQDRQEAYKRFNKQLSQAADEDKLRLRETFTRQWLQNSGLSVSDLKGMLGKLGYYKGTDDNTFGQDLAQSIILFQTDHALEPVDGICGELCLAKLRELGAGVDQEYFKVPLEKRPIAITLIHETGKPRSYTAVYTLDNDLFYGIASSSLKQGSLFTLLCAYCESPGARFADRVKAHLARLEAKDPALASDEAFNSLLARIAGEDALMLQLQDRAIEQSYFDPARQEAATIGVKSALGLALIADTVIQSGRRRYETIKLATIKKLDGTPVTGIDEKRWLRAFAEQRIAAYASRPFAPLVKQRTQTYLDLMDGGRWQLEAPLRVRSYLLVDP